MENVDGKFVTTWEEFKTFDYSTLYPSDSQSDRLYALFAHPAVPFIAVTVYLLISNSVFDGIRKVFDLQPKGAFVQPLTTLHSLLLAVYSGWTCYNALSLVIPHVLEHGFFEAMCDSSGDLWTVKGLGWWVTHFYLSKYWEFLDTWIIVMKGRKPIWLQTYHHAGVVVLMWGFIATRNTAAGAILMCLNSFIHTLMYSNYTLAAAGVPNPMKNLLTMAQMVQFVVGISIVSPMYMCFNEAQAINTGLLQLYAIYLTYLFYQFYVDTYTKKKGTKKAE